MKTGSLLGTCTLINIDGRGETIVAPEKSSPLPIVGDKCPTRDVLMRCMC